MATTPTLSEIAAQISTAAKTIDDYIKEQNLPTPSLAEDGPLQLPLSPEVAIAKSQLSELLLDMKILVQGPGEFMTRHFMQIMHDISVLNVLNQFNFWDAVPLNGSTTYAAIASKTGLNESLVRRILRHAMTNRVFAETAPGSSQIVHTAPSSTFVREPMLRAYTGHNLEDMLPATIELPRALRRYGCGEDEDGEPDHCAAALAFFEGKDKSLFEFFARDEDVERGLPKGYRAKRFGQALTGVPRGSKFRIFAVNDVYEWEQFGDGDVLVDIGGSAGHLSVEIAEKNPKMKFVVQDRPEIEDNFNAAVPGELRSQITFQAHDFFTPQPIKGASVYLLKSILHDWSDTYSVKILRQIVPVMGPKSRIILMEGVIPPPGSPNGMMRLSSTLDLHMLIALNSKERTIEDWGKLCKMTDERLEIKQILKFTGLTFSLIEIVLKQ